MRMRLVPIVCFLVIAAVLFFVTKPFYHDGFFPTMDDVQVVRIDEMSRELESGQFPVRLANQLGNGGGYPLFNFYAPFVYYLGALYHFASFTFVQSTKLVFLTGYFVGTVGMFVLLKKYVDWLTTTIGVALFLTATYVNYDVYTRGALAEFFALMLLPWLFWSFLQLKEKRMSSWKERTRLIGSCNHRGILSLHFLTLQNDTIKIVIAGFFYSILVITHNITSFTATIFLGLLLFIPPINRRTITNFGLAILIGLGLSAFFWIPVVLEQRYTVLSTTDFVTEQYKSNFLNPLQVGGIQQIPWGFKPPLLGTGLFLGALILSFWGRLKGGRRNLTLSYLRSLSIGRFWSSQNDNLACNFFVTGFFLSLFLIWSVSKPLWDYLPYMRFMQFPWRYLSLTTVFAVLLVCLGLSKIRGIWVRGGTGLLIVLIGTVLYASYLRPSGYNYIAHYYAEDSCRTTAWAQEQLPIWVKACLPKNDSLPLVDLAAGSIVMQTSKATKGDRLIEANVIGFGGLVTINKYYYPGWTIRLDGQKQLAGPATHHGIMQVEIPPGDHTLTVEFKETPLRTVANYASLISFFVVTIVVVLISLAQLVSFLYNRKSTYSLPTVYSQ